ASQSYYGLALVVHTTNPSSEDSMEIYAEVVKGLGETLVGAYPGCALSFVCKKMDLDSPKELGYMIVCQWIRKRRYDLTVVVGWGTNKKLIISILAHRNAGQCSLIRKTYAETYGEDLLKSIKKELSSDLRAILLWIMDPAQRDAFLANEATKRWTSSNRVLMEIACTRSSHELLLARQAYHSRLKKSLKEDVAFHTTGDFRKLLVLLVSSYRYDGPEVNMILAKSEAKILRKHISEKEYSHDDFIIILTTRSKAQLNATLNHYNNEFGTAIIKDLKYESEDNFLGIELRSIV
ncbi:hypothetical protein GIB67_042425, partial [Kingdonia uniflora]